MNSLRMRLLLWLLAVLMAIGVLGGVGLYQRALAEADVVFDEQLQDTAVALRDRSFLPTSPTYGQREAQADLVVQVWSLSGVRVYSSQRHATMPGLTTLGFSTVATPDERWRVFGLQTPFNVIQVAQPMRVRQSRAARLALSLLAPPALLLPVLGLIIWITVGRALRPLRALATDVGARPADEIAPLPLTHLPVEVRPLVLALNDLLARLSALRERERRFIADAAHELRTPLTALRLQLRGLDGASDTERRDAAQALGAGIDRSARLVEQMLALARQDAPESSSSSSSSAQPRAALQLADLARETVADLLPAADAKNIDLGLSESDPGMLTGDAESLRALLRNLVDNALRYSPEHSRVDVVVERVDDAVQLRVIDEGPGIAPAERARVFDRFYRVAGSAAGGSGLGLAIVRRVAESHGASVTLDDAPQGRGLQVIVRFLPSGAI